MRTPFNPYQNTQVTTASRERILIMLYDGAISFTQIALERMKQKDLSGKGIFIGKAQAIVMELMNTLNHEVGGEIAVNLERLYLYLIGEYSNANLKNDKASLESAIKVLTVLRGAWEEATEICFREKNQSRQMLRTGSLG